jgi:hypothetical protein
VVGLRPQQGHPRVIGVLLGPLERLEHRLSKSEAGGIVSSSGTPFDPIPRAGSPGASLW